SSDLRCSKEAGVFSIPRKSSQPRRDMSCGSDFLDMGASRRCRLAEMPLGSEDSALPGLLRTDEGGGSPFSLLFYGPGHLERSCQILCGSFSLRRSPVLSIQRSLRLEHRPHRGIDA